VKNQTTEGLNIPAFSVQVPISQPSSLETQLFTLSRKLMIQKFLTVGHALLSGRITTVPIANMSCQDVWLDKGTTLWTSQTYTDKIFQCNLEDSELIPSLTQEVTEAQKKIFELEKAINLELQDDDKAQLKEMLKNHIVCFASNPKDVGRCNVTEHTIQLTEGTQPIKRGPYRRAWKARTIMQTQVNDMLESSLIEISNSAWSFPVVLILKSDGTWRFCVDYRGLNEVTIRNVYPLPRISDILSKLQGAEYFFIMDLQSGYHQLPLRKEDREKQPLSLLMDFFNSKYFPLEWQMVPVRF
jgi:hypothetical protein